MRAALLQQRGFIAKGFIVSCHEALMPCSANTMHAASYSVLSQVSSAVLIDDCLELRCAAHQGSTWLVGVGELVRLLAVLKGCKVLKRIIQHLKC